jgi:hypothetical protein
VCSDNEDHMKKEGESLVQFIANPWVTNPHVNDSTTVDSMLVDPLSRVSCEALSRW